LLKQNFYFESDKTLPVNSKSLQKNSNLSVCDFSSGYIPGLKIIAELFDGLFKL